MLTYKDNNFFQELTAFAPLSPPPGGGHEDREVHGHGTLEANHPQVPWLFEIIPVGKTGCHGYETMAHLSK